MGSMPDYERAHQLNPDRFPKDANKRVIELETQLAYLADELARLQKRSRSEVLADAVKATESKDAKTARLAQREEPKAEVKKEVAVTRDSAAYFANPEQGSYYPMTEYIGDDDSAFVFFKTPEEAEAKGYTLRAEPTGDAGSDSEEDVKPKPKKFKKGK